jgi:hypothetical protein
MNPCSDCVANEEDHDCESCPVHLASELRWSLSSDRFFVGVFDGEPSPAP